MQRCPPCLCFLCAWHGPLRFLGRQWPVHTCEGPAWPALQCHMSDLAIRCTAILPQADTVVHTRACIPAYADSSPELASLSAQFIMCNQCSHRALPNMHSMGNTSLHTQHSVQQRLRWPTKQLSMVSTCAEGATLEQGCLMSVSADDVAINWSRLVLSCC